MGTISELFQECKNIVFDTDYSFARQWKKEDSKRVLIGMIPNYFPREIIHAANGLAIGIVGSEFKNPEQINQDKSHYESCSILSGVIELVRNGQLDGFDGFLLPSQCTPIKEMDEIDEINKKCTFVKYINFPQYFHTIIGDIINHYFVQDVLDEIYKINGIKVNSEMLNNSIQLYKNNLKLTERIYSLQKKYPEKISQEELYYTVLSGLQMPIEKHSEILNQIIGLLLKDSQEKEDDIFDAFSGAFC